MQHPGGLPPAPSPSLLLRALRWLTAVSLGVLVTIGIFAIVLGVRIDPDLVESLLRFFPLHQVSISVQDRCAMGPERLQEAVDIAGSVGMMIDDEFVAIEDAEVLGERLLAAEKWMAVEPGGHFRLVTALPKKEDDECALASDGTPLPTPQLVFRAPGCAERRVPVVRPWIPRRIVLDCTGRG
jgi:hypothetical protein